jgi:hypothetical protein
LKEHKHGVSLCLEKIKRRVLDGLLSFLVGLSTGRIVQCGGPCRFVLELDGPCPCTNKAKAGGGRPIPSPRFNEKQDHRAEQLPAAEGKKEHTVGGVGPPALCAHASLLTRPEEEERLLRPLRGPEHDGLGAVAFEQLHARPPQNIRPVVIFLRAKKRFVNASKGVPGPFLLGGKKRLVSSSIPVAAYPTPREMREREKQRRHGPQLNSTTEAEPERLLRVSGG